MGEDTFMTMLLCIIYLSFISLGLPDSLLGAVWPTMRVEMNAPLPLAGMVSMLCSGCTIISSLFSVRLIRRYGTGRVTMLSTALTAVALLGYAYAPTPWVLFLAAIPLGLGGGCVDSALNNYVALYYEARHMSWLHCFWGVGATGGSMILSLCIGAGLGWRSGYLVCIGVQSLLVLILASTLPMWKQRESGPCPVNAVEPAPMTNAQAMRLPGMKAVMLTFACYCAAEGSMMLWTASYAQHRGATNEEAALLSSVFFAGLTAGRGLNGFLANRFSGKALIRAGGALMLIGILTLFLPLGYAGCAAGVLLIGLGCAPIYPCTIHETPHRFGAAASQVAMGLQVACAYTGSTFMPPLFGVLSDRLSMGLLPWWMLLLTGVMVISGEVVNRRTGRRQNA